MATPTPPVAVDLSTLPENGKDCSASEVSGHRPRRHGSLALVPAFECSALLTELMVCTARHAGAQHRHHDLPCATQASQRMSVYQTWTLQQLTDLLRDRQLKIAGNKKQVLGRIQRHLRGETVEKCVVHTSL